MTTTFINGTEIASMIQEELVLEVKKLKQLGVSPGLAVVLVGSDEASSAYVNMKARMCERLGIVSRKLKLQEETTTEELTDQIRLLNEDDTIDGILVQLPLPTQIDKHAVLEVVAKEKDVDGFHSANIGSLCLGHQSLVACTPLGIMELLHRSKVSIEGARAAVIGRSDDVGKPIAMLLMHAHATVTICHSRTADLAEITSKCDIVIAAIGSAAAVTAEFIKPGATVIDVGSNKISHRDEVIHLFGLGSSRLGIFDRQGYIWVGDVHEREVKEVASKLTPVPGGVGPMTIAMLMKNTLKAANLRRSLH